MVKATFCVGQKPEELIHLVSMGNGHGASHHNPVYYLVDVRNNKKINSREN